MIAAIAFVQLGAAVLLAGYWLFRFLMARALAAAAPDERERLWGGLAGVSWPAPGAASLSLLGWGFAAAVTGGFGVRAVLGAPTAGVSTGAVLAALLLAAHLLAAGDRGRPVARVGVLAAVALAAAIGLSSPRPVVGAYSWTLALHAAATLVWLGHMFFWSVFAGPAIKRLPDPAIARRLRELSLSGPGLGWPALVVLAVTGVAILRMRGISLASLVDPAFASLRFGGVLDAKLALVALMVVYQAVFGHREAPRAILANMAVALAVLLLATLLTGV